MINVKKQNIKKGLVIFSTFCLGFLIAFMLPRQDKCWGEKPKFEWDDYVKSVGHNELDPFAFYRPEYTFDIEKVGCQQLRNNCADEISHMVRGKYIYEMRYECQAYIHECI